MAKRKRSEMYANRTSITQKGIEKCDECGSMNTKSTSLKFKCYNCGVEWNR